MADEDEIYVNQKLLTELRVVDLKQELDKRGLSKTGSKHQLIERLKAQIILEGLQRMPVEERDIPPNQSLQEGAQPNEFVKKYLEQQQLFIETQRQARKKFEEEERRASDSQHESSECSQDEELHPPVEPPAPQEPAPAEQPAPEEPSPIQQKRRRQWSAGRGVREAPPVDEKRRRSQETSGVEAKSTAVTKEITCAGDTVPLVPVEPAKRSRSNRWSREAREATAAEPPVEKKAEGRSLRQTSDRRSRSHIASHPEEAAKEVVHTEQPETRGEITPEKPVPYKAKEDLRVASPADKVGSDIPARKSVIVQKDRETIVAAETPETVKESEEDKKNLQRDSGARTQSKGLEKPVIEQKADTAVSREKTVIEESDKVDPQQEKSNIEVAQKETSVKKSDKRKTAEEQEKASDKTDDGTVGELTKGDKSTDQKAVLSETEAARSDAVKGETYADRPRTEEQKKDPHLETSAAEPNGTCAQQTDIKDIAEEEKVGEYKPPQLSAESRSEQDVTSTVTEETEHRADRAERIPDKETSADQDEAMPRRKAAVVQKKDNNGTTRSSARKTARSQKAAPTRSPSDSSSSRSRSRSSSSHSSSSSSSNGSGSESSQSRSRSPVNGKKSEKGSEKDRISGDGTEAKKELEKVKPPVKGDKSPSKPTAAPSADVEMPKDPHLEGKTGAKDKTEEVSSSSKNVSSKEVLRTEGKVVKDLSPTLPKLADTSVTSSSTGKKDRKRLSRSPPPQRKDIKRRSGSYKEERNGDSERTDSSSSESPSPTRKKIRSIPSKVHVESKSRSRSSSSQSSSGSESRSRSRQSSESRSVSKSRSRSRSASRSPSKNEKNAGKGGDDSFFTAPEDTTIENKTDRSFTSDIVEMETDDVKTLDSKVDRSSLELESRLSSRLISRRLSRREKSSEVSESKEFVEDGESKDRPVRKRKWGSKSSKPAKRSTTFDISTESLKGLIPEIKPTVLPEPVLELADDESLSESEDEKVDVPIQRTVIQTNDEAASEDEEEEEADSPAPPMETEQTAGEDNEQQTVKIQETAVKVEQKIISRRIAQQTSLVEPDEPLAARRSPSPARNPASTIVHVKNLVRPFTLLQLKELLKRTGKIDDDKFWIDRIKSHCYAMYDTEEEAAATRKSLHGTTWPSSNPKILRVDYASKEELNHHLSGDIQPQNMQRQIHQDVEPRKRRESSKEKKKEKPKEVTKPIREWDLDKLRDRRRSRERSRSREKRRQERSKERKEKREKKVATETPAKLLDDLFKKTKATPCIYWLPLTEAQIVEKEKDNQQREAERQKRKKEMLSQEGNHKPERRTPSGGRDITNPRRSRSPSDQRRKSDGNESKGRRGDNRDTRPEFRGGRSDNRDDRGEGRSDNREGRGDSREGRGNSREGRSNTRDGRGNNREGRRSAHTESRRSRSRSRGYRRR